MKGPTLTEIHSFKPLTQGSQVISHGEGGRWWVFKVVYQEYDLDTNLYTIYLEEDYNGGHHLS